MSKIAGRIFAGIAVIITALIVYCIFEIVPERRRVETIQWMYSQDAEYQQGALAYSIGMQGSVNPQVFESLKFKWLQGFLEAKAKSENIDLKKLEFPSHVTADYIQGAYACYLKMPETMNPGSYRSAPWNINAARWLQGYLEMKRTMKQ